MSRENLNRYLSKIRNASVSDFKIGEFDSFSFNLLGVDLEKNEYVSTYTVGSYFADWSILSANGSMIFKKGWKAANVLDIKLGRFIDLKNLSPTQILLEFDSGLKLNILSSEDFDDELLHIFMPNHLILCYYIKDGWRVGASNKPWRGGGAV